MSPATGAVRRAGGGGAGRWSFREGGEMARSAVRDAASGHMPEGSVRDQPFGGGQADIASANQAVSPNCLPHRWHSDPAVHMAWLGCAAVAGLGRPNAGGPRHVELIWMRPGNVDKSYIRETSKPMLAEVCPKAPGQHSLSLHPDVRHNRLDSRCSLSKQESCPIPGACCHVQAAAQPRAEEVSGGEA